jgi:RNA polymerase subunit RPABC4/transcription elongation factor Spt4
MPGNEQNPPPPPNDSQTTPTQQSEEGQWYCDECGAEVTENDDNCPKCGASIYEEEKEPDEQEPPHDRLVDEEDQEPDDTATDDADEEQEGVSHLNYLSDDTVREVILSFYSQNPDIAPREIYEKLKRDNLRDLRGKYVDKHYIAGLKALFYRGRGQGASDKRSPVHPKDIIAMQQQHAQTQAQPASEPAPPAAAPAQQPAQPAQPAQPQTVQYGAVQMQTVPQPAPQVIPVQQYAPGTKILTSPAGTQFVMPVKKTLIETLIEGFERASAKGDIGAMTLFAENITRAVERSDDSSSSGSKSGPMDKLTETMITVMGKSFEDKVVGKGGKGEDEFERSKKYFQFFKDLQGDAGALDSNVQMASIITDGIKHGVSETRRTILQVSGHDSGDEPEPCPNCNKIVPADALICPYCGVRFETEQAPALPQQQPVPQIPQYAQQRAPQYMTPSQMPQYRQTAPQAPQYPPQPQVAPPMQPAPQPQIPVAVPQEAQAMRPPVVYDGILKFPPQELESYKGYIKKLTSAINHKLDIITPINLMWTMMMDEKAKKYAMLAVIMGEKRLYYILNTAAPQVPDMAKDIATLNSVDGHSCVSEALAAVEGKINKEKMKVPNKELNAMVEDLESKLGFQIPDE